jgi:hypothetical protein
MASRSALAGKRTDVCAESTHGRAIVLAPGDRPFAVYCQQRALETCFGWVASHRYLVRGDAPGTRVPIPLA